MYAGEVRWSAHARTAVTCQPHDRWTVLRRGWRDDPGVVFACTHRGGLYLLDQRDDVRARPSPASSLAVYEADERVDRIEVRHLLMEPARMVGGDASLSEVAALFVASGLRPLEVVGPPSPLALTVEGFLRWLAGREPPESRA
jgi:hypothetical protein